MNRVNIIFPEDNIQTVSMTAGVNNNLTPLTTW